MSKTELYQAVIDKYGITAQSLMVAEECSELIKAVSKLARGNNDTSNLIEEIADVRIVIEEMMVYYKIKPEDVDRMIDYKMKRLQERL